MKRNVMILGLVALLVIGFALIYLLLAPEGENPMNGMGRLDAGKHQLPAVLGYAAGDEIHFVHPESSDPAVSQMLTQMMGGSPVLVVPALAEVPDAALATVYVFTNGIEGDGPLGFQPDVFDNPPDQAGYSPLRSLHRVTWLDGVEPRLLTSAAEVVAAETAGELIVERTDIVINMPFLSWPGGER